VYPARHGLALPAEGHLVEVPENIIAPAPPPDAATPRCRPPGGGA